MLNVFFIFLFLIFQTIKNEIHKTTEAMPNINLNGFSQKNVAMQNTIAKVKINTSAE